MPVPDLPHGRLQMQTQRALEEEPESVSRRNFFAMLCIALSGLCAATLGVPLVGFILAPLFRKTPQHWIPLGKTGQFEIGKTVNVTFVDASPLPWAGITARNAAWLRRASATEFIAFSVNCTHLGCPVRWFAQSKLFLCPCHGGAYYEDGSRASGPPERGLFEYKYRIDGNSLVIHAGDMPTLATEASCKQEPLIQIAPVEFETASAATRSKRWPV